jgi:hypothetical protein
MEHIMSLVLENKIAFASTQHNIRTRNVNKIILIEDIPLCCNSQNKIKRFILSEHSNIYNHQHPSMAICFSPFLDHPQANI